MVKNKTGDRYERELVNHLDTTGFAVMRAPASGSSTERELPDVLAGDGDGFWAIEAKYSSGDPIYLTGEEIEALIYFASNFGAEPRVGIRFAAKHGDPHHGTTADDGWRFYDPADLHETDGGNFRVKKERMADGETIDDLYSA